MADDVMAVWWRMGLTEQGMAVEYVAHGSEVRRVAWGAQRHTDRATNLRAFLFF
jgi:hypothetical protein